MCSNKQPMYFRLFIFLAATCLLMTDSSCNRKPKQEAGKGNPVVLSAKLPDSVSRLNALADRHKVNDNRLAIRYAGDAVKLSKQIGDAASIVKSMKMLGLVYSYYHKDSSYVIYNRALKYAREYRVTREIPQVLYNIANLHYTAYAYTTAISLIDTCIRLARPKRDYEVISNAYNLLGNIYHTTGDTKASLRMYDSSYIVASLHNLTKQMGVAIGNMAKFEQNTDSLICKLQQGILLLMKTGGNEEEIASMYNNIAVHHSNPDSVLAYSAKILFYCKGDNLQLVEMGAYNNMAYALLDKGDITGAERALTEHAIPIAEKINDLDWLSNLYDTYADVAIAKKEHKLAFDLERKAYQTRLRAFNNLASEQVRLLAAILDLKSKDEAIRETGEELKSKQEHIRNMWFGIGLLFLIILAVLLIFSFFLLRNRLKYQRSLTQSARRIVQLQEDDKARVAKELHDLVGPMIFSMNRQVEEMDIPDEKFKNRLLDHLHDLANHLRSISHRMNKVLREGHAFSEVIIGLFEDMNALSPIPIHLTMTREEPPLLKEQFDHVYRVLQELLTNGIKHVNAGIIEVDISWDNDSFFIFYKDSGPGFNTETNDRRGMGLMNIFERTGFLEGRATLKSNPGTGTIWTINIPVKPNK